MVSTQKKRKYNFIDVILLIVIIAIAAFLIYLFISPFTNQIINSNTVKIEYKILIEGVRDEINYIINEDDKVTETELLSVIGKVKRIEYTDSEYLGVDLEGKSVIGKHPGKKDITITVEADASDAKGVYETGGFTIAAGKKINFRVPGFTGEGSCIYVGKVTNNE